MSIMELIKAEGSMSCDFIVILNLYILLPCIRLYFIANSAVCAGKRVEGKNWLFLKIFFFTIDLPPLFSIFKLNLH